MNSFKHEIECPIPKNSEGRCTLTICNIDRDFTLSCKILPEQILIAGVLSAAHYFEKGEAIRETWINFKGSWSGFFIVGNLEISNKSLVEKYKRKLKIELYCDNIALLNPNQYDFSIFPDASTGTKD